MRVICDGYGLAERGEVVRTVLWWQDRCRNGIVADAAAGLPHAVRLVAEGVVEHVGAARDWVAAHRADLDRALR